MTGFLIAIGLFILGVIIVRLKCGPKYLYALKDERESTPSANAAHNDPEHTIPATEAQNSSPSVSEYERARQQIKECRECWTLGIEILGLLGLFAYSYITFKMWQEAKDSVDASTHALHITERPWVSATSVKIAQIHLMDMTNNPTGHFDVDVAVSFKNSGASIAREGATRVYIYPGYSGSSYELASVPTTGITSITFATPFAGVNVKSISLGKIWDRECKDADAQASNGSKHNPWETGFVLAPGASASYYETVINNGVTLGNMSANRFMVLGCVSYRDGFNIQHHTRYCFIGRPLGPDPNVRAKLVDCAGHESAN